MAETCSPFPASYTPLLDVHDTEDAIREIKHRFQGALARALSLRRVTAPLFVPSGSGINDDLNGIERPVRFSAPSLNGQVIEVVQSLAKWKRLALADLDIPPGSGLYTDMNAIRPDETLDNLHSLYVDQWDWERSIRSQDRTLDVLERTVERIYSVLRSVELHLAALFPQLEPVLPESIAFVHASELAERWPDSEPEEREHRVAAESGAVFIIGIGAELADGRPHDGRAPDYDDWITPNGISRGLNGDLVVWHPVLERAFELSSMGIRVDPRSLVEQLEIRGCPERLELPFHRRLAAGELPPSIGGGIGQSRLCTFLLRKVHIGEIQAGLWPEEMRADCAQRGIPLL